MIPRSVVALAAFAGGAAVVALLAAGPLDPPGGPVAPTGRTLTEIEPRTPLSQATTPGDADSTFKITQSGSYYLASNLAGEAAKKGIEILVGTGAQVTLDLGGFTLNGTGATSTQPAIFIDGSNASVVIRNGNIRAWRGGITHSIGGRVQVEDVHAYACTANSFDLRRATVLRCTAEEGTSAGFFIDGGVLIDCQARSMTGTGFTINNASIICRGCISSGNAGGGYNLGQGVAENCTAEGNTGAGFSSPGTLTNCTSISNGTGIVCSPVATVRGCTVVSNDTEGIRVSGSSRIEGNSVVANGTYGIRVIGNRNTIIANTVASSARSAGAFAGILVAGNDNAIDGNHVTDVLVGGDDFGIQVTGISNLIVRNQLSGISTYFSIGANNTSGGASGNASTAGPWTNITY